jgi:DNA-binding CsgD family transcriptional regulator
MFNDMALKGVFMKDVKIDDAAMRVTDVIRGLRVNPLEEILEIVASDFDLKYIAYIRFASHSDRRIVSTIVTYPSEWQSCYFEKAYVNIDPVVAYGCESITPFDWDELKSRASKVAAFFEDAAAHDIGRNGVSFPIRNRAGGFSLVSFTSDHTKDEWALYKEKNMATLHSIAWLIDSAASFSKKAPAFTAELSQDERDCLALFAKGRNENHIGEELGISITEVRLYLDTARHKLRCVNVTQAVAVAIATEAIPFDFRG